MGDNVFHLSQWRPRYRWQMKSVARVETTPCIHEPNLRVGNIKRFRHENVFNPLLRFNLPSISSIALIPSIASIPSIPSTLSIPLISIFHRFHESRWLGEKWKMGDNVFHLSQWRPRYRWQMKSVARVETTPYIHEPNLQSLTLNDSDMRMCAIPYFASIFLLDIQLGLPKSPSTK